MACVAIFWAIAKNGTCYGLNLALWECGCRLLGLPYGQLSAEVIKGQPAFCAPEELKAVAEKRPVSVADLETVGLTGRGRGTDLRLMRENIEVGKLTRPVVKPADDVFLPAVERAAHSALCMTSRIAT